ncbi:hypothetical protein Enr10x_35400 [Gimesia panareensis]|uniref:Uncharacterized protein n=1 Tax=Gimesia panareensis TaxID=2527978 RepID=A0A517Q9C8_9PLAN|nr:hypothetical protein Enr10x_35400 [Gimesia panareensis]
MQFGHEMEGGPMCPHAWPSGGTVGSSNGDQKPALHKLLLSKTCTFIWFLLYIHLAAL